MGCQTPGRSYSDENTLITLQEHTLGFSPHSTVLLEATFYRLLKNDLLPEASIQPLKLALSLSSVTDKLTKKLSNKDGVCEGRKLLLYSLLLGQGGDRQKAVAIWNVYEEGEDMPAKRLEDLLTDIASVSLVLPMDFCEANKAVTGDRLRAYFQTLSTKLPKAVNTLKGLFPVIEGRVGKAAFVEVVGNKTAPVTNTRAVRSYIEQTKAMAQKFAAAFDKKAGFQTKLQ